MMTVTGRKSNKSGTSAQPGGRALTRGWGSVFAAIGLVALGMVLVPPGAYALPVCTTNIAACCKITSAGSYTIPADFTASISSGTCIDIVAPGVSLGNANGNVTGPGSSTATVGVTVESTAKRSTVSGCFLFCTGGTYKGFGTGLVVNAPATTISTVGADNNGRGMVFNGAGPSVILSGASNNVSHGFIVNSTATSPLLNTVNASNNGGTGIKLNQVAGGIVEGPTASSNGQYGIWLNGTAGTTVSDLIANSNFIAGVYLGCSGTGPSTVPCSVPTRGNIVMKVLSSSTTVTASGPSQKYGVVVDLGNSLNRVQTITAQTNTIFDMFDGNAGCANNLWFLDTFTSANQSCIQ